MMGHTHKIPVFIGKKMVKALDVKRIVDDFVATIYSDAVSYMSLNCSGLIDDLDVVKSSEKNMLGNSASM